MFRFIKTTFISIGALVVLGLIAAGSIWYAFFAAPSTLIVNEPRLNGAVIDMASGTSLTQFAERLKEQGVIKSPKVFLSIIEKMNLGRKIKQGTYVFTGKQNAIQVIEQVTNARYGYEPVRITIPEGYATFNIAELVPTKLVDVTYEDFMQASEGLEGYLFPDTYFLYPYATSSHLISLMEANFERKIAPLKEEITSSSRSLAEIIIMASILEKEVQTPADMADVSDLFWSRIAIGMPLQADSTLTYVTGKTSAQLSMSDLTGDSPYNSYKLKGLPPTPISNPGINAIQAALRPTENEYLFFLSDENGTTHFSETYEEHLRLKKKYLP